MRIARVSKLGGGWEIAGRKCRHTQVKGVPHYTFQVEQLFGNALRDRILRFSPKDESYEKGRGRALVCISQYLI